MTPQEESQKKKHNANATNAAARRDYATELREYEAALRIDPGSFATRVNIATAISNLGRYEEAERLFLALYEENKKHPTLLLNFGVNYVKSGQYEKAIPLYEERIALTPKSLVAYDNLTRALIAVKAYRQAFELNARLATIVPDSVIPYYNRGIVKVLMHDFAEADRNFRLALVKDKRHSKTYLSLGGCLFARCLDERTLRYWLPAFPLLAYAFLLAPTELNSLQLLGACLFVPLLLAISPKVLDKYR